MTKLQSKSTYLRSLTSLFLFGISLLPSLGLHAMECETIESSDGPNTLRVKVCVKCEERDDLACVHYTFAGCSIRYSDAKAINEDCANITCPNPAPTGCVGKQPSSYPYGAVEGEFLYCGNNRGIECRGGRWQPLQHL